MRYAATFNPTVTIEVEHPPDVGFLVDEVVFAGDGRARGGRSRTPEAACEAEWVQVLTQELVERGARVARGGAGPNTDAVIAVTVTRCETEQEQYERREKSSKGWEKTPVAEPRRSSTRARKSGFGGRSRSSIRQRISWPPRTPSPTNPR